MTYVPPRGYTGVSLQLCFKARGAEGQYRVVKDRELCISIHVLPCLWTVRDGENLAHISEKVLRIVLCSRW